MKRSEVVAGVLALRQVDFVSRREFLSLLRGGVVVKAVEKVGEYLRLGLVELLPSGCFLVKPIPTITKQYHKVFPFSASSTGFSCDCQGFQFNGSCSHVGAVVGWLESRKASCVQVAGIQ